MTNFLGLGIYLRGFLPNFLDVVDPLQKLLQKDKISNGVINKIAVLTHWNKGQWMPKQ